MRTQALNRFIFAFIIITTSSSIGQEKNLQEALCPKAKDIPDLEKGAFSKSAPRGIFALIPWGKAPEPMTWKDPGLDGVTIRRYWKEFNPGEDEYDWKELDEIFAEANSYSKKIDLIIAPGFYSPKWVLNRLDDSEKPFFTVPHGEYGGDTRRLPLPWNATYLNLWFKFVEALANKYGANPALSLIAITGPNSHNGEVNLPGGNKRELEQWKDLAYPGWRILGGEATAENKLKDKMLAAYGNTIDCFDRAFAKKHEKHLSLQIFNEPLPVERDKNREPSAIQLAYHCELIQLALDKLGKYFVLMNGGLEAWPITDAVSKLYPPPDQPTHWVRGQLLSDLRYITGLLQKDAVDDLDAVKAGASEVELFRLIIKNGVRFGANFLVIFEKDIHDERLRDLIAAGRLLVGGPVITDFGDLIYVDRAHTGEERGTSRHPYNTIAEGRDHATPGSNLIIAAANYPENLTFTKPLKLIAVKGNVSIGQ
jgi:hypothetical protein